MAWALPVHWMLTAEVVAALAPAAAPPDGAAAVAYARLALARLAEVGPPGVD